MMRKGRWVISGQFVDDLNRYVKEYSGYTGLSAKEKGEIGFNQAAEVYRLELDQQDIYLSFVLFLDIGTKEYMIDIFWRTDAEIKKDFLQCGGNEKEMKQVINFDPLPFVQAFDLFPGDLQKHTIYYMHLFL